MQVPPPAIKFFRETDIYRKMFLLIIYPFPVFETFLRQIDLNCLANTIYNMSSGDCIHISAKIGDIGRGVIG